MRYRLLLYGYISIIAGILFVLVSPQQALADDKVIVAPESVTCHHPTYEARDINVGGKVYKGCFLE